MGKFKWGPEFYKINRSLFDMYRNCKDSKEVVKVQTMWLEKVENESKDRCSRVVNVSADNDDELWTNTNSAWWEEKCVVGDDTLEEGEYETIDSVEDDEESSRLHVDEIETTGKDKTDNTTNLSDGFIFPLQESQNAELTETLTDTYDEAANNV